MYILGHECIITDIIHKDMDTYMEKLGQKKFTYDDVHPLVGMHKCIIKDIILF